MLPFRFSRSHTSSISRFVLAGFSGPLVAPGDSVSSLPTCRASPVGIAEKSSFIWMFCCLSSLRLMAYWPLLLVRAFNRSFRLIEDRIIQLQRTISIQHVLQAFRAPFDVTQLCGTQYVALNKEQFLENFYLKGK